MADVKPVSVQILGNEYHVSSPQEEVEQLQLAAKELDRRMREIKSSGKIVGTERIAVMAALNMAYELLQGGGAMQDLPQFTNRINQLQKDIDLTLESSAQMELR